MSKFFFGQSLFINRLVLSIFSLFFIFFSQVNYADALSAGGISAFPSNPDPTDMRTKSWFIYNLNPGESREDSITIRNDSETEQSLKIYTVDAIVNNVGGFALGNESDQRSDVGRWVELEKSDVVLRAGESQEVKFKIKIPSEAGVGEHAGGIVIQKGLTEDQKKVQGGFVITTRLGVRIYQTVPGEIVRKASFGEANFELDKKTSRYVLAVPVKNDGNVSLEAKVVLAAKDKFFGRQDRQVEVPLSIPRGSQMIAKLELPAPKVGKFEADLKLSYNDKNNQEEIVTYPKTFVFWAIPWSELALLALIVLANLVFFFTNWWLKRRESRFYKDYQVYEGEDLTSIANSLGVSWKKLAKINHLKAPYRIYAGQTITVYDKKGLIEYEEEDELELEAEDVDVVEEIEAIEDGEFDSEEDSESDDEKDIPVEMPIKENNRRLTIRWKKSVTSLSGKNKKGKRF